MGAGLGFKTFVTGDVLTAADTNGYLMQGVWVFASAAARDAAVTSPQEGNVCYLKDTDAMMTYSGAGWIAVGQTRIKQMVVVTSTTNTSNSTSTYTNTNVAATITPTSSSSTILVQTALNGVFHDTSATAASFRIVRGATTIASSIAIGESGPNGLIDSVALSKLDSPATTSATTYTVQIASQWNSARAQINRNNDESTIILMEYL